MRATGFTTLSEWLTWLETLHPKQIDMSLGRIRVVLERLGLATPDYTIVTVGGTNGKGSCVAMLASVYRAAGFQVGAYTSPHLWRYNERICCNGEEADDATLIALFERIEAARGDITLSYFESSTAAALLHFADRQVDVAVLEVGLGGRLDAVNAVDADAVLIASVDLDHQQWLGSDRESVGREKAGIMRAGRAAVVADRRPPSSLLSHADDVGADLILIGRDFDCALSDDDASAALTFGYRGRRWKIEALPRPGFGGDVQFVNAAAVAAVVEALDPVLPVTPQALARGLAGAQLRGRVERHALGGCDWLFDVAHNPAAARELAARLARMPGAGHTFAVFSAMQDKDIAGVLAPLAAAVDGWFVTQTEPQRGATAAQMDDVLRSLGATEVHRQPDVETACRSAQLRAAPGDRVLVFGSFYLVGPAMAALGLYSAPTPSDQSARWTGV